MRLTSLLLVLLVGSIHGFAPAPVFRERPDDSKAVLRRLQGTWTVARYEQGGRTVYGKGEAYTIVIEKDHLTYFRSLNGSSFVKWSSFTLKLDPTSTPAEIDLIAGHDPNIILSGVYDLKDDTLRMVYQINTDGKKDRAKGLVNPSPNSYFMRLERRP